MVWVVVGWVCRQAVGLGGWGLCGTGMPPGGVGVRCMYVTSVPVGEGVQCDVGTGARQVTSLCGGLQSRPIVPLVRRGQLNCISCLGLYGILARCPLESRVHCMPLPSPRVSWCDVL